MAVRIQNLDFTSEVSKHLRRVHDLPRLILRVKKVLATVLDWMKFTQTLEAATKILDIMVDFSVDTCDRAQEDISYVRGLLTDIDVNVIRGLCSTLDAMIDFEKSQTENILCICEDQDYELDRLRVIYDGLDEQLVDAAKQVLEECPLLQYVSVEYMPQIGYLVVIDSKDSHFLDGSIHGGRYKQIYSNEGKLYYKHSIVDRMDENIGDIKALMLDRQKCIVLEIENMLLNEEFLLIKTSICLDSLDAILSLGSIAAEMNFVRPEITEEPVIVIKNGRHPLQALSLDGDFVANDTFLSLEKNIGLITGFNGSGKSVYMKQVK